MLMNMDSRWRFAIAGVLGLAVGLFLGTAVSNIYVAWRYGQDISSIDPLRLWYLDYPQALQTPAIRDNILLFTSVITAGTMAFGLGSMVRSRLSTYGSAHWQSRSEMRRNRMLTRLEAGGFIFAKLGKPKSRATFISTAPNRWPHAMMVAPTGAGKGVGFVIPNLLQFPGSAVVLDIKSENFHYTSIYRQKTLGQKIWYFSPFDLENGSHRFNPMARIARMPHPDRQYTALNVMLDHFLTVAQGGSTESFLTSARQLFVACALFVIETNRATIGDALEIMGGGKNKKESYLAYSEKTTNPLAARIFHEMSGVPDKILGSYISVLEGAGLALWKDPNVRRVTAGSDFDFSTFRREGQTLYISMTREDLHTLAPLVRLLFADAISTLQRAEPKADEPHQVMFLLDEFDQLGRMPIVENAIKTIRSFGGRFVIISQSIAALDEPRLYGRLARLALQAGAGVQLFMTPQETHTAEEISKMLGKHTVVAKSESGKSVRVLGDSASLSRRSEERPLMSPDELLRFPRDEVIVLPQGQPPIRAQRIQFYEDRHFLPLVKSQNRQTHPHPEAWEAPPIKAKEPAKPAAAAGAVEDRAAVAVPEAQIAPPPAAVAVPEAAVSAAATLEAAQVLDDDELAMMADFPTGAPAPVQTRADQIAQSMNAVNTVRKKAKVATDHSRIMLVTAEPDEAESPSPSDGPTEQAADDRMPTPGPQAPALKAEDALPEPHVAPAPRKNGAGEGIPLPPPRPKRAQKPEASQKFAPAHRIRKAGDGTPQSPRLLYPAGSYDDEA